MKLKQHITDTMKEWQMKIGYNYEKVCLYYPASSLYKYINSEKSDCLDVQKQKLNNYIENNLSVLGDVKTIWDSDGKRVCIEIPAEGSKYVNENIKEPELLVEFLKIINDKTKTLKDVEKLFNNYAHKYNGKCNMKKSEDGHGKILYFSEEVPEQYVYCVEDDEFGITYHRFEKTDYEL